MFIGHVNLTGHPLLLFAESRKPNTARCVKSAYLCWLVVKALHSRHAQQGRCEQQRPTGMVTADGQVAEGLRKCFSAVLGWCVGSGDLSQQPASTSSGGPVPSNSAPSVGMGFLGQLSDIWRTILFSFPLLAFHPHPYSFCPFSHYNTFKTNSLQYITPWNM